MTTHCINYYIFPLLQHEIHSNKLRCNFVSFWSNKKVSSLFFSLSHICRHFIILVFIYLYCNRILHIFHHSLYCLHNILNLHNGNDDLLLYFTYIHTHHTYVVYWCENVCLFSSFRQTDKHPSTSLFYFIIIIFTMCSALNERDSSNSFLDQEVSCFLFFYFFFVF